MRFLLYADMYDRRWRITRFDYVLYEQGAYTVYVCVCAFLQCSGVFIQVMWKTSWNAHGFHEITQLLTSWYGYWPWKEFIVWTWRVGTQNTGTYDDDGNEEDVVVFGYINPVAIVFWSFFFW